MKGSLLLIVLFIGLAVSQTYNAFRASFVETRPNLQGRLSGTMYYSLQNKGIRLTYSATDIITRYNESDPQDFFIFNKCGSSCQSSPLKAGTVIPNYYKTGTDTCSGSDTTLDKRTCTPCNRPTSDPSVASVCVDGSNAPLKITLKDGTQYHLSNHVTTVSATEVDPVALNWGCVLNCDSRMDIVLVVDESGSIGGNYDPSKKTATGDWANVRTFAKGFVDSFTFAPDKVNMGLIQFQSSARKIISQIISDGTQFRSVVDAMYKNGGGTNINSGITLAYSMLQDYSGARALRTGADRVIVLMTDGQDSSYSQTTKNNLVNNGITVVAIGVGSGVNAATLQKWASSPSLQFSVNSFNVLATVQKIKELSTVVCSASGSTPCPGCLGLCACGVCTCPDSCEDDNQCTTGTCTTTVNNKGGCFFKAVTCDDSDSCTDDSCNPASGCVYTPFDVATRCSDGDPCTEDTCTPAFGCSSKPVNCTNENACLIGSQCVGGTCTTPTDICTSQNPCVDSICPNDVPPCTFTPKDCTGGNKCILPDCNTTASGSNGCLNRTRDCNDFNACSIDTCDPAIGCVHTPVVCDDNDPCTDDSCDKELGCVYTPINATERCFNGDICSVFTCETGVGCKSEPKNCSNNFNDTCIDVICDPILECIPRPVSCNISAGQDPNCFVGLCSDARVSPAVKGDRDKAVKQACYTQESDSCVILRVVGGGGAAVLGVGAIVAIIIAAVVCAGGTTAGVVLGYNKIFSGEFENKSQIYEPETKVGSSGIYEGKS